MKNIFLNLGTIITEWDDGFKICKEFLETEDEYRKFALHLVSIAEYFKLDGWLLNVENKVENVPNLIGFIEHLTNMMHQVIPGSTVIWYDSVINDGSLKWQNRLNDKNRLLCSLVFF